MNQDDELLVRFQVYGVHETRRYGFCYTNERGEFTLQIPKGMSLDDYQIQDNEYKRYSATIEDSAPLVLRVNIPKARPEK